MSDVRSRIGTPLIGDFASRDGTPLVIDTDSAVAYFVDPETDAVTPLAGSGAATDTFKTIAVSGQSDIVADGPADTLNIAAGSNITITTNAGTDTLTISASSGGDVVGPASATNNAVALYDSTTGKLIKNSVVTIGSTGNVSTPGGYTSLGGTTPTAGTDLALLWTSVATLSPVLSLVAATKAANSRIAELLHNGTTGLLELRFTNDAYTLSANVLTASGSSAGVTAVALNGTALTLNGLTSVPNALKVIAGGVQPGVTVSATNDVVVSAFPYRQWIDAAPAANNKIVDMVFAAGVFQMRFVNDAYSATTPFFSITGGHAAGVTAIAFPAGPVAITGAVTATALITANSGVLVTGSGGGTLPGVTVSATKSVVNGGFPYRQWIDAAQSANNKMCDIVFAAGAILHRFVNDAYGASTTWMSVTGGHASGLVKILFPSCRVETAQGAAVASANNLTLGNGGNYFQITGTTQINLLVSTDWQGGSHVTLKFNSTPTVKHNQAVSGVNKPIMLAGAVDFVATALDTLSLVYDSTDSVWYETARAVI